jgi:hypothetical protein
MDCRLRENLVAFSFAQYNDGMKNTFLEALVINMSNAARGVYSRACLPV